jgi:branched-chain amino acid transport system substrate-binding protein
LELSPGYKDELFGTAEDFARDFERTHRYEPPDQAAQSAAAVHAFAAAFARAQNLDPETVRSAIAETELETFYGPIKFDGTGRNIAKRMVLTQVQGAKHAVVFPAKLATGAAVVPRPPRAP